MRTNTFYGETVGDRAYMLQDQGSPRAQEIARLMATGMSRQEAKSLTFYMTMVPGAPAAQPRSIAHGTGTSRICPWVERTQSEPAHQASPAVSELGAVLTAEALSEWSTALDKLEIITPSVPPAKMEAWANVFARYPVDAFRDRAAEKQAARSLPKTARLRAALVGPAPSTLRTITIPPQVKK